MEANDSELVTAPAARSMVSLDHNGPSVRVVIIGSGNVVYPSGNPEELGELSRSYTWYTNSFSFGFCLLSLTTGLAIGVWADVLIEWLQRVTL